MLYELAQNITFAAQFFDLLGGGLEGLAVTVNVYAPDGTPIITSGSATELSGGIYTYPLDGEENDQAGEWIAIFSTTIADADIKDIADRQQVVAIGFVALKDAIDALAVEVPFSYFSELSEAIRSLAFNTETIDLGDAKIRLTGKATTISGV